MCFSPEADLVGGVVIGAIGIDALLHGRHRREATLAVIPVLLAAHQIVEAFVWWGLRGDVPAQLGRAAMWIYLVFAFCVLPVLVPAAIASIEPGRVRRRLMGVFLAIGLAVAVVLGVALARGPTTVSLAPRHLQYGIDLDYGVWIVLLYVVATCGSLLVSGYRYVVWFGVLNLAAVLCLAWLAESTSFASLWCAWAAAAAGAIALHLRYARHRRRPLQRSAP